MADTAQVTYTLNGKEQRVAAGTSLLDAVKSLGANPDKVVVERNLEIVPAAQLADVQVAEGDTVEVIQFVGGG